MSFLAAWLDAVSLGTAKTLTDRALVRGRAKTARGNGKSSQAGSYRVDGLERRLFLSTAIAAFGIPQTFATDVNPLSVTI
ncbi:MAG TPA: hypothetical protein VIM11_26245 [Tepidisphaeraceae bacterium]|jgi:hypothetical protein